MVQVIFSCPAIMSWFFCVTYFRIRTFLLKPANHNRLKASSESLSFDSVESLLSALGSEGEQMEFDWSGVWLTRH
jgi:hypothetical protein